MQETNLIEQEQPVGAILSPIPAPAPTMTLCSYGTKLTREELARVATPAATATHKPIPHIAVVEKLIEALGFRQIGVVQEEYAVICVSRDWRNKPYPQLAPVLRSVGWTPILSGSFDLPKG